MSMPEFAYIDGKVVPWDDARIHVFSAVSKAGAGVFEGLRGYWNKDEEQLYVFRMPEHMQRLEYSQKVMRFETIISAEQVTEATLELLRACNFRENVHIRPMVYVEGFDGPPSYGPIGLAVAAVVRPPAKRITEGTKAQISSWRRLPDSAMPIRVKCNANYNNNRMALMQAHADGYGSAIFLTTDGKVSEGAGMCLFIVRDGVVLTPPVTADILESITRATVIQLCQERLNREVVVRDIDRSELYAAEEVFFCGTGWEIAPVIDIDNLPVGDGKPGSVTRQVQDVYFQIVRGELPDHPEWRTPVYEARRAAAE